MNTRNLVIQALTTITIAFIWYILSLTAWSTYQTHIAMYLLISFLATMCSAAISVQRHILSDEYQNVLHNAMIYTTLVFLANAIYILFNPAGIAEVRSISWQFDDLYYLATFSILVLLGVFIRRLSLPPHQVRLFVVLSTLGAIFLHALFFFSVVVRPESDLMIWGGTFLGLIAGTSLSLAGILWMRLPQDRIDFNLPHMIMGFTIFGISWIPMVLNFFIGESLWTLGFPLRVLGLFFILLGVSVPFLKKIGMNAKRAYQLIISIALLGFIPVVITTASEVISPGLMIESISVYQMSHLGASVLLFVIAFLVIVYSKQKPEWNRYPIIFLYTAWIVIELFVLSSSLISDSVSLVPYVVGSLLSLASLPIAIRWTLNAPKRIKKHFLDFLVAIGPVTTLILLIIANLLETVIVTYYLDFSSQPFARGLLMITNLLVLFAYTYLAILLVNRVKGRIGVDMVAIGALLLWIVPVMLKGNYTPFTIGWWASEMFLLGGLLAGPTILGIMYVRELSRAESAQRQATLFADLLVHDISNYHQAITVCLGLMEEQGVPKVSERILQDALTELERADNLIKNVRRLGLAEKLRNESLEIVDVLEIIKQSVDIISNNPLAKDFQFRYQMDCDACLVSANILLLDVFNNILLNAVKYSLDIKRVEIHISKTTVNAKEYCVMEFVDFGQGISPAQKQHLFVRYMDGAFGTGLGLAVVKTLIKAFHGYVEIRDRVEGDYTKGTRVRILLPSAA